MKASNLIVILSDEHNKRVTGCYGHPIIKTPNLDQLAARGTRFTSAYTNCPICVPARASFATGQYVHKIRYWDNAIAYDGKVPSWGHRLMEKGHRVTSIGKLHYIDSDAHRNGFDEEILPLHIVNRVGDLLGLIRDELPVRPGSKKLGPEAGPGESEYTHYDRDIAAATQQWLTNEAPKYRDKPWVIYVGFVSPHFPLIAPPQFYNMYPEKDMPWPLMYEPTERPRHPFIDAMRKCLCFDDAFDAPMVRRALAAYFGLVSFLDDNIGKILATLEATGLASNTRVIYSSDHGDNLGTRGMWGKSTMYEESAGIPLIIAGPEVPQGNVCDVPVTLGDAFPTLIEGAGEKTDARDAHLPGHSLLDIAQGYVPKRTILSEYHAAGAVCGSYMIRHGKYKYIYY
ncbi:MAG TPA: sulfatase-like hydrolase/transferase, partial [Burkholderiales bacterium]|nr:sulfatase-like hydrolase/transferase [Burkholderiales bacterium]